MAIGANDASWGKQQSSLSDTRTYFSYLSTDNSASTSLTLFSPNEARYTPFITDGNYGAVKQISSGRMSTSSQYDGFSMTLQGGNTMTGTIKVYGWN
jgi:hypothetical protein